MESQFRMELKPFPMDDLPDGWMKEFVQAVAASVQVSPDMVAVPLLATLCVPLQNRFVVRVDSSYTEPLCLYTLTIARPSERKSAITHILEAPLWEWQKIMNDDLAEDQKPTTLYVTDATPEKLAKLMTENKGAIALISDEPDALAVAAGLRYGKSRNLGLMLQAWSAGHLMIQRATNDQRISIDRAVMSVAVMSQPSFVEALMKDGEMSNRGFMQRFLYAKPLSQVGNRSFIKPGIPEHLINEYYGFMQEMLRLNTDSLRELRIAPEAEERVTELFDAIEQSIGQEKTLEGWHGKLFGQCMRIAGVLHCVKWGKKAEEHAIDLETIESVFSLAVYFQSHARVVFTDVDKPEYVEDARELYRRMKESGKTEFTKSDLYALTNRNMSKKRLEEAIVSLWHSQHITIPNPNGTEPKDYLYTLLGDTRSMDESEYL